MSETVLEVLIGIALGAVVMRVGYLIGRMKTVAKIRNALDHLEKYEEMFRTPWKQHIGNQFAITGRPETLLITDEYGQHLRIEWPEKPSMIDSKISTNLKGIPEKEPIPTEIFDAVRSWWGEMNAAALTKGEQHGNG